jgi:hypothetical protein
MSSPAGTPNSAPQIAPLVGASSNLKGLLHIFTVCLLVWSLDYKSATSGGGAAVQGLILGVYLMGAFFLVISALMRGIGVGPVWLLIAAITLFVLESAVVGLVNDQDGYAIFVNTLPALVLASSTAITYMTLASLKNDPAAFLKMLRYSCLVFVIVHLGIVVATRGSINLSESRFEVLSAATTPALAIIAIGFMKRLSKLDVAIFVLNLFVSVISVTRTLLVVLALQIFAVIAARPRTVLQPVTLKAAFGFGAAMLLILAIDFGAGTGMADRWIERVTVSRKAGADPTSLTRKAEVSFMLNHFETSPQTFLFGNGLAAKTSLTGPDARLAAQLVGAQSAYLHSSGFGHENYVSILFTAGVLGGGGLLFMLFLNGLQGFMFLRRFKLTDLTEVEVHLGLWGALIVIGTLVVGFFAGTFGDRDQTLWYGIGTAMLYWARENKAAVTDPISSLPPAPTPPEPSAVRAKQARLAPPGPQINT